MVIQISNINNGIFSKKENNCLFLSSILDFSILKKPIKRDKDKKYTIKDIVLIGPYLCEYFIKIQLAITNKNNETRL